MIFLRLTSCNIAQRTDKAKDIFFYRSTSMARAILFGKFYTIFKISCTVKCEVCNYCTRCYGLPKLRLFFVSLITSFFRIHVNRLNRLLRGVFRTGP